jgi:hypothetical protein
VRYVRNFLYTLIDCHREGEGLFPWYAGRSEDYDYDDGYPADSGYTWWEILFFPILAIFAGIVFFLYIVFLVLAGVWLCLKELFADT